MIETWMIEEIGIGRRDLNRPVLWFTVSDGESHGALQVFALDDERAIEILTDSYEVGMVNGRMCHIERDGNTISFVGLLRSARAGSHA